MGGAILRQRQAAAAAAVVWLHGGTLARHRAAAFTQSAVMTHLLAAESGVEAAGDARGRCAACPPPRVDRKAGGRESNPTARWVFSGCNKAAQPGGQEMRGLGVSALQVAS